MHAQTFIIHSEQYYHTFDSVYAFYVPFYTFTITYNSSRLAKYGVPCTVVLFTVLLEMLSFTMHVIIVDTNSSTLAEIE